MFFVMQNIWSYSIFINFNAPNVFFQKWKFSLFGQSTCYELNIFCPIWLKFCVWPPFVFTFAVQEWFHSRKNIWPDFLFFFSYGQKFEKIVVMPFLKDIGVLIIVFVTQIYCKNSGWHLSNSATNSCLHWCRHQAF